MFYPVDPFNSRGAGICIRKVLYTALSALAVILLVLVISFSALAAQQDNDLSDPAEQLSAEEAEEAPLDIDIIEEIDLGDQGIFLAGHELATVHVDGEVYTVDTELISEDALTALYALEDQDYIEEVENDYGFDVYVNRMTVETTTEEVEVAYETTYVADSSMEKGKEIVTTEGQNGVQVDTYEITTLNGETTTELVSSEVTVEPVDEVITYGTKTVTVAVSTSSSGTSSSSGSGSSSSSSSSSGSSSSGTATGFTNSGSSLNRTSETISTVNSDAKTFTTSGGTTYSYSKVLTCTAYAYCTHGTTASGTTAREGAIAVDPSVIPLGSRLYIIASDGSVVYGVATAEDTGGSIKGNTVDLFYDSESQCYSFGCRSVTIYILN